MEKCACITAHYYGSNEAVVDSGIILETNYNTFVSSYYFTNTHTEISDSK